MCNIAGYVGTGDAAPILLSMLKKQEGYGGGYYTGIATIHEGKIHYAKLTGDVDRLTALTDAAQLPGKIGIIHSRSKSGGGDAWAHPFVGLQNGEAVTAYVANGSPGIFAKRTEEYNEMAQSLCDAGYTMLSREIVDFDGYNRFADGTAAHMSDVMCQLITKHIVQGETPTTAMNAAFCEMPTEVVGLLLSLAAPDCITWTRITCPMHIGFASHGAYLSTAAMAIPNDAGETHLLPSCAGGSVWADRYAAVPYPSVPAKVAPMTARVKYAAYDAMVKVLSGKKQTASDLCNVVKPLFDKADCTPDAALVYDVLDALEKEGRLCTETIRVAGARDGIDAPQTWFWLE